MAYQTEQEEFWAGNFGTEYIFRNKSEQLHASNLKLFSKAFDRMTDQPKSILEFGANIGMNLKAIKQLVPDIKMEAIEINKDAANHLIELLGKNNVHHESILDFRTDKRFDISLIKTVLIHINPDELSKVYETIYKATGKYILICEYYNPSPVSIIYRGHNSRLFKRDFAGELLDMYNDLELIDYGFTYHRDPLFPLDDITWFLLKK